MMTIFAFSPFIVMGLFFIFGAWLIISDIRDNPEKPEQKH